MMSIKDDTNDEEKKGSKKLSQIFKETPFSYDRIGKSYITKKPKNPISKKNGKS